MQIGLLAIEEQTLVQFHIILLAFIAYNSYVQSKIIYFRMYFYIAMKIYAPFLALFLYKVRLSYIEKNWTGPVRSIWIRTGRSSIVDSKELRTKKIRI